MTSRFGTLTTSLQSGTTARAEAVNTGFSTADTALIAVGAELNRAFRFTDGTPAVGDFQLSHAAGQRALKCLGFDSTGAATLLGQTFAWKGAWVTATAYVPSDIVTQGADSSLYMCLTAHTSGTFATDLAATKWVLIVDLSVVGQYIRRWQIITSNYTAVAGDDLFVDVSGGAVTITLPASPAITDQPITITHVDGTISSNNITVARNGKLIMGAAANMTVSTANAAFELSYCDTARGWRLSRGV